MERFTWICMLVVMLGTTSSVIDASLTTCNRTYKKVGCFQEGKTNMTLIINDRDGVGIQLNWTTYEASIHSLACRCAQKAEEDGYQYFSIRFWAECWAGRSYSELNAILNDESKKSTKCASYQFKTCNDADTKECVGKAEIEYMYAIAHWAGWQQWSRCSVPCGKGTRQRVRTCSNIENVDRDCKGGSTDTEVCNTDDCPACEWEPKKFGIGSSRIHVIDIQSKEQCLTSCLWKGKKINGVNFYATTPPRCYCVQGMKFSSDNNLAMFCKLNYGYPSR